MQAAACEQACELACEAARARPPACTAPCSRRCCRSRRSSVDARTACPRACRRCNILRHCNTCVLWGGRQRLCGVWCRRQLRLVGVGGDGRVCVHAGRWVGVHGDGRAGRVEGAWVGGGRGVEPAARCRQVQWQSTAVRAASVRRCPPKHVCCSGVWPCPAALFLHCLVAAPPVFAVYQAAAAALHLLCVPPLLPSHSSRLHFTRLHPWPSRLQTCSST